MNTIPDSDFDKFITEAMNQLPQDYIAGLDNVVIIMEDNPTSEQIEKMKIDRNHLLLGLFEGVAKTLQGSGWSGMLPSKITLFKNPLLAISHSEADFFENIKRTLWHEMAHYYGLSHADMDQRQRT